MRLVLFNIGWMERYQGQTPDDSIHGGGGYPDEHGHGFEVENFLPIGGWCYGHGEPPQRSGVINLKRVDPGVGDGAEYLDGVTVVSVATRPEDRSPFCFRSWKVNGGDSSMLTGRSFQVVVEPCCPRMQAAVSKTLSS